MRGIRIGAHHRADDVVRGRHVGDPVAQRLVGRVLERAGARLDRHHRRAEQLHPVDVERLARDVLGAHVHHALEPEARADRGGGDAVLSRAGLGDDAPLAHPEREQRLADRVVDLVRAGVVQVLALEHAPIAPASAPRRGASVSGEGRPTNSRQQRLVLRPEGADRRGRRRTAPRDRRARRRASRARTGRRRDRSVPATARSADSAMANAPPPENARFCQGP